MKIIRIISEYNPQAHPGKKGMVEAIVRLKDGSLVTRHIYKDAVESTNQEQS